MEQRSPLLYRPASSLTLIGRRIKRVPIALVPKRSERHGADWIHPASMQACVDCNNIETIRR